MKTLVSFISAAMVVMCLVACGGHPQKSQEEINSYREALRMAAQVNNDACPQQATALNGVSVILESVIYDSNVFQYNYFVDSETFNGADNDKNMKDMVRAGFRANPKTRPLVEWLIYTDTKLVYRYCTRGGKTIDLVFTSSELESFFD